MPPSEWQAILADAVTSPDELCRLLHLPASLAEQARRAAEPFAVVVPRSYLKRIRHSDPEDPLLRQILPSAAELPQVEGFVCDPLSEAAASPVPGLLSKYRGRSLIVATGRCGVHCRFCFRRHHPTPSVECNAGRFADVLDLLRQDQSIHEAILSGGDPLVLDDRALAELADQLSEIKHLQRLRLHSRMPVVIPQRITDELLAWCGRTRLTVVMVIHINHPNEIDDAVAVAIGRLVDAGIPVLSQTVLLRGVNDNADVLEALFERLVALRVMPYYLHQLDRVAGAAHFEVAQQEGCKLVEQLRSRLPGYAIPRYVRDIPGNRSKHILA